MKSAKVSIINATGAGDAFMAGLAYSYLNELDIESTLKFSIGASIITLENENTINPNISVENIEKKNKGVEIMMEKYMDIKEDVKKGYRRREASSGFRIYYYFPWNALSSKCKNRIGSREYY